MNQESISDKQAAVWRLTAVLAPLAHTAAAGTWPAVAITGGGCLLVSWAIGRLTAPCTGWLGWMQCLWNCVVISEVLHWCGGYWADHASYKAASMILLLLAGWAAAGGEKAPRAGSALFWLVLILLGTVVLSGLAEVRMEHLQPQWRMPDACLVVVTLLPCVGIRSKKDHGGGSALILVMALLVSSAVAGVLSPQVSSNVQEPLYVMSQSIKLFGAAQRMESLVAVGMSLGYFVTIGYLLQAPHDRKAEKKDVWWLTAATAALFVGGLRIDSSILALGSILFWVILPLISTAGNNFKKM